MKTSTLRTYGWRPIVSDAHAMHLLRRELKHHNQWNKRNKRNYSYEHLLSIKKGNWYKIVTKRESCGVLIWRLENLQEDIRMKQETKPKKFVVYFNQVNQTKIEVSAMNHEDAIAKAARKWRKEEGHPDVRYVEEVKKETTP